MWRFKRASVGVSAKCQNDVMLLKDRIDFESSLSPPLWVKYAHYTSISPTYTLIIYLQRTQVVFRVIRISSCYRTVETGNFCTKQNNYNSEMALPLWLQVQICFKTRHTNWGPGLGPKFHGIWLKQLFNQNFLHGTMYLELYLQTIPKYFPSIFPSGPLQT